jgi:hypothetical protein
MSGAEGSDKYTMEKSETLEARKLRNASTVSRFVSLNR